MSSTFLILYHYPYPLLLMLLFGLFFIVFLWLLLELVYTIEQSGRQEKPQLLTVNLCSLLPRYAQASVLCVGSS